MSAIFGGSKQKSQQTSTQSSSNQAYAPLNQAFLPGASAAFQAGTSGLRGELSGGYDAYAKNTGLDFWKQIGLKKAAGGFSGRGLFDSGATRKAMMNYNQGISSASYDDFLKQQATLAQLGLQGGGLVAGAGGVSSGTSSGTSSGKSSPGLGGFIGSIIGGAAASDERLKTDITKIGEHGGLGIYEYNYISGQGPYIGVMAQEVQALYPDAMGPEVSGYLTVDYTKLQELTGEIKYG